MAMRSNTSKLNRTHKPTVRKSWLQVVELEGRLAPTKLTASVDFSNGSDGVYYISGHYNPQGNLVGTGHKLFGAP